MINAILDYDEIERLNEEIFKEEQEDAWNCPNRSRKNPYLCDRCSIIDACYSIPDEY